MRRVLFILFDIFTARPVSNAFQPQQLSLHQNCKSDYKQQMQMCRQKIMFPKGHSDLLVRRIMTPLGTPKQITINSEREKFVAGCVEGVESILEAAKSPHLK